MNNKPIGVFDSGLGGLTAVKEIMRVLPYEDIIYFGDTGRVPYGSRSKDTIIKYTKQDINFLKSFDIKIILAACGTASSVALPNIKESNIKVIGVVEPAAKAAVCAAGISAPWRCSELDCCPGSGCGCRRYPAYDFGNGCGYY